MVDLEALGEMLGRQQLGRLLTGSFQQFERAKLTLGGSSSVGR
jgi:hypothetical protein